MKSDPRAPVTDLASDLNEAPHLGCRSSSLERTRRFRQRRRAGILVVSVEITPEMLEYLARGTSTSVEILTSDRSLLSSAVRRALKHGCNRLQKTGHL